MGKFFYEKGFFSYLENFLHGTKSVEFPGERVRFVIAGLGGCIDWNVAAEPRSGWKKFPLSSDTTGSRSRPFVAPEDDGMKR